MPRPREFDESAALEAAMECFWRRGYEATSLRDLTASMGLTAPSLYNAFGGKQELFTRALECYLDRTTRDRLRRLEQSLAPRAALHRFFTEIIEHSIGDRQRKGCFLVNSALEIAPHDAECRAVITEQFNEIEAFFRRCILKAQADKTVSSDVDAGRTTPSITARSGLVRDNTRTPSNTPSNSRAVSPASTSDETVLSA